MEPWQDPNALPFIRIQNVTKKFGDLYAVDNVSLDIYRGEFFALLGPSGCGKTTLLRMLAGFETPTQGRILIDGQDMAAVPPWRRPVNMMFQSYALFPHMTVEDNIAFGLKQERLARSEIRDRVAEAIRLVQLEGREKRRPDQLSGGQKQRVALARAIVKRPKVLLLDEPLGALDKKLRERTQFELVNVQETLGLTFVIVTHDQEEAMTVSTRMAVMNEGQVVQLGTPAEMYEYPASRFVADFLGDVNVLEARVVEAGRERMRVHSEAAGCDVLADRSPPAVPGETVWVAIRPEKFVLAKEPPADPAVNCMAGEVWDIGYLGDVSIYHVRLASGVAVRCTQANRQRLIERPITWEDRVWLTWAPDASVILKS
ncbi:ABC transporter ATP-binding protein [Benzoatithermus flavus]|uniref:ABC transporter ATP-binding protein n=1 Tax=Benzoatithermus flavus TaxID=3108223 RepID=UPI003AAE0001